MKGYVSSAESLVVGHARNRELRHMAGHCVPISLEVVELSRNPVILSATLTEIECSRTGVLTTDQDGVITACDANCGLIFGYEKDELLGQSATVLSSHIAVTDKEPRQLLCNHRDGTRIFVSVAMEPCAGGYRGIIHRVEPPGGNRSRAVLMEAQDKALISDLVGWYEVTR